MHFLLISENEFFHEIKRDGITSFTDFALIIFGKMLFLLISENKFFHEMKGNGMTSFMEFMNYSSIQPDLYRLFNASSAPDCTI